MDGITAEKIGSNTDFAYLFILTAERARAHAFSLKEAHVTSSADKEIAGRNRSQIISRLTKAAKVAGQLVTLLQSDPEAAKATPTVTIEAIAYQHSLLGECEFEKLSLGVKTVAKAAGAGEDGKDGWKQCLTKFAVARVIYGSLLLVQEKDCFREVLALVVDQSMEYASYRAHGTRTAAVSTLSKKYFPKHETEIRALVESVDPTALEEGTDKGNDQILSSVSWRGKTVELSDAAIGQSLAAIQSARVTLDEQLAASVTKGAKEQAGLYDNILTACQDSSDRVRQSIEELQREGITETDARMQSLRVISLAVNYDLINWRIGRNRTLIGLDDGIRLEKETSATKTEESVAHQYILNPESTAKRIGRLKERVMQYDAILQSIVSIKELPGASRDTQFVAELDAQYRYFRALRCLNLGYYHASQAATSNVLGLLSRGQELAQVAVQDITASESSSSYISSSSSLSSSPNSGSLIRDSAVSSTQAHALSAFLNIILTRYHGLADIQTSMGEERVKAAKWAAAASAGVPSESQLPLIERMSEGIPARGIDPTRLVDWPPVVKPIPVKPVYLDLAWDFIQYPGVEERVISADTIGNYTVKTASSGDQDQDMGEADSGKAAKKGWFW